MNELTKNPNAVIPNPDGPKKFYPFVSIDPGKNLGYAVGEYCLDAENAVVTILIDPKVTGAEEYFTPDEWDTIINNKPLLARKVNSFIFQKCEDFKDRLGNTLVITENQYWNPSAPGKFPQALRLIACEAAFLTAFHTKYAMVVSISPSTVRSHFGIATGDYNSTKKMAVSTVKAFIPENQHKLVKVHHTADAILQLYYHFASRYKDYKINVSFKE